MAGSDYCGSDAQRALLMRGAQLHLITRNDTRYSYYGRTVGAVSPDEVAFPVLLAMARLQGNSAYANIADAEVEDLRSQVIAEGLVPVHYARWEGAESAVSAAKLCLSDAGLAGGYSLSRLTDETPEACRLSLERMAQACGVLLPSLAVLSGREQAGVCTMAIAPDGSVAGCAAAAAFLHPDHPRGKEECWWGMLAVHPDHRGKAISLSLGAAAIVAMREEYGFTVFFTGVEAGNTASEAICRRMGLTPAGRSIIGMADASLVPGGRMTK